MKLLSRIVASSLIVVSIVLLTGCMAINAPPVAAFSVSRSSGTAPLYVSFNASGSYDSDGRIISYAWSFEPGALGSGESAGHTFSSPGYYTVSLTVEDDDGATDTAIRSVSVSPPSTGPSVTPADFVVSDVTFMSAGEIFLFGYCVDIYGTVTNRSPVTCGVELEATAYDATGLLVGKVTFWPASTNNIPAGTGYPIDYFIYGLKVQPEYVTAVYIRPISVHQWTP